MSWAGKEILIKAVAQAIPTYAMGCFDITKSVCDQISSMICRFWWDHQEGKHKIHWMSKDSMMKPKSEEGLGFRDIHAFNMAMLAKQSWRLWHNPDSLCARVLKAKYYPTMSVLEAKPKDGMSYTWRSILRGLEIMKKGMIWRVGDGSNLKIWSDPWLPRDNSRKPFTPKGASLLRYVHELINPITGSWDEGLINDTFWPEDADIILSLPLFVDNENRLAWHFDKKGMFSVRSAYKVCREDFLRAATRNGAQGSSGAGSTNVWDKLWKMECPNKVKHFLWRLTHNSHPLRCNLARQGMKINTVCPVCNRLNEDGGHQFFKCKFAKKVWRELCLERERQNLSKMLSPWEVTSTIMQMKGNLQIIVVILMWFLWTERNAVRENGRGRSAKALSRSIRIYTDELSRSSTQQCRSWERKKGQWNKPPSGVLKLNCDGSFRARGNTGSWGFLIRDSDVDIVTTGRGRVNHLLSAFHAELIACLQGVHTALNLGIGRLIL